jgi:hypothetical protein
MAWGKKAKDLLPKEGIKEYLHHLMPKYEPARPIKRLHASDITNPDRKFCAREYQLLDVTGEEKKGMFIGTSLRYTFDLGELLHEEFRNRWARAIAVGDWKCRRCKHVVTFCKHPGACSTCGHQDWHYQELRFKSKSSGISGGIDVLLHLPGEKKYRIVELKSIDKDQFKVLKAPKAEHRKRTNLYMRLVEEYGGLAAKMINLKEASVLYMVKGFGISDHGLKGQGFKDAPFTPFKEYHVKRDDALTQDGCDEAIKVIEFREQGGCFSGRVCIDIYDKRVTECAVSKQCFGDKYKEGTMPKES